MPILNDDMNHDDLYFEGENNEIIAISIVPGKRGYKFPVCGTRNHTIKIKSHQ